MTYVVLVGFPNFASAPKKDHDTVAYIKLFHHVTFQISTLSSFSILGLDPGYSDWEYSSHLSVPQADS
jgi:hypothetical protein